MNYEEIVQLHIDTFGVAPVITGLAAQEADSLIELLVKAIVSGIPYVEQDVPDGALT
jgi:hypothetical protein|tara:strand:- start:10 stop:180 length:171 start_codon:yes stop_codon:yes gene_type:complete